jgi:isopentenyl-diphosphate delta-isomerase
LSESSLHKRKTDHIELAFQSQSSENDHRFYYEPVLGGDIRTTLLPQLTIANKTLQAPIWVSSMTGGAEKAKLINQNLAKAVARYGLGMGLGSCRPVLEQKETAADFAVRKFIGDQPLFANLGIAQLEQLIAENQLSRVDEMIKQLESDGLIIHVNPLQEWFQPEGDRYIHPPIETIQRVLDQAKYPVMVKEVGQGMGPKSLKALLKLPLEALDYGAFGGTNFSLLENLRREDVRKESWESATKIGHTAVEMTDWISGWENEPIEVKNVLVSGGIKGFLDGFYHMEKLNSLTQKHQIGVGYAQAASFLKYALLGEEELFEYIESQLDGLRMAQTYLTIKE